MKIRILSDLHLEFSDRYPPLVWPPMDAEVVVLAGDIDNGTRAIDWAESTFPASVVLYVPGNHEFYDREVVTALDALRERAARSPNVRLMDNDEWILDGVRFLGTTLWTDFALYGARKSVLAMAAARQYVTDFRAVRHGAGLLTPAQTVVFHRQAVNFLEQKLHTAYPGPTVVITHHAPHAGSVHPKWGDNLTNAAFVSDLSPLMGKAELWIHGHTHDSFDYSVAGTRVVTNPMGYRFHGAGRAAGARQDKVAFENSLFDPVFAMEV